MLMSAPDAWREIALSSSRVNPSWPAARQILLQLGHAARADQHGGDAGIAQRPGQRHLRERLAPGTGDLIERAHLREVLLAELPADRLL